MKLPYLYTKYQILTKTQGIHSMHYTNHWLYTTLHTWLIQLGGGVPEPTEVTEVVGNDSEGAGEGKSNSAGPGDGV